MNSISDALIGLVVKAKRIKKCINLAIGKVKRIKKKKIPYITLEINEFINILIIYNFSS